MDFMRIADRMRAIRTELAQIKLRKAEKIIRLRAQETSDKMATLQWQITEDGQREMTLEAELKGLEDLRRARKAVLDVKRDQGFGNY